MYSLLKLPALARVDMHDTLISLRRKYVFPTHGQTSRRRRALLEDLAHCALRLEFAQEYGRIFRVGRVGFGESGRCRGYEVLREHCGGVAELEFIFSPG